MNVMKFLWLSIIVWSTAVLAGHAATPYPDAVREAGIAEPVLSLCGTWQFAAAPAATFFTQPDVYYPRVRR